MKLADASFQAVPTRLCRCGCGGGTSIAPHSNQRTGRVKGQPYRFIRGHNGRKPRVPAQEQLCACGCGKVTTIAKMTYTSRGHVVGQPTRYLTGHGPSMRRPLVIVESTDAAVSIALNARLTTTIDACDLDLFSESWFMRGGYVARRQYLGYKNGRSVYGPTICLHRVILARVAGRELERGELGDHINGDRLNNRRSNLRIATPAMNSQNQGLSSRNKSGFRNVFWNKRKRKWAVMICVSPTTHNLGFYETAEEAGRIAHEWRLKNMPGYIGARMHAPD